MIVSGISVASQPPHILARGSFGLQRLDAADRRVVRVASRWRLQVRPDGRPRGVAPVSPSTCSDAGGFADQVCQEGPARRHRTSLPRGSPSRIATVGRARRLHLGRSGSTRGVVDRPAAATGLRTEPRQRSVERSDALASTKLSPTRACAVPARGVREFARARLVCVLRFHPISHPSPPRCAFCSASRGVQAPPNETLPWP